MNAPNTNSQRKHPDFLVVGVAKAGTTHLYEVLQQHSGLFLPDKESFFFNRTELLQMGEGEVNHPYTGLLENEKDYQNLFAQCPGGAMSGEVGTGYFYDYEHAIPKIKSAAGDPKIIVLLRHPVSRCYSSYTHFVKLAMEELSFEEALEAEQDRKDQGFSFMWHYKALSQYADAAAAYQAQFSQVKFLFFEQMVNEPEAFYEELFEFLELPREAFSNARTNASGKPKNAKLQGLITKPNPIKHALRPLFRAVVPMEKRKGVREWLKSKNMAKSDAMLPETRAQLQAYFKEDIARLRSTINHEISYWNE